MAERPELVVGLVGPVGADLHLTTEIVVGILRSFAYFVADPISLSALLDRFEWPTALPEQDAPRDEYIDARMTAGNELRRRLQRGDALAMMAVREIAARRRGFQRAQGIVDPREPPLGVAYVLRSLKHAEEVAALRNIYRERFVLIGAHAPREWRVDRLAGQIAASHGSTSRQVWQPEAHRLANRDESEEADTYGQDVRGTLPLADFFVNVSSRDEAVRELDRFFRSFFGYPFATPTPDEYAMFHAAAAAVRSADLSRQVGAAIAGDRGDIIAVGCNEVPAFGGGSYWVGDANDARDFMRGDDANARLRNTAIEEIRRVLVDERHGLASETLRGLSAEAFREILGDTRVDHLTEFNRAVHAEMSAILDAARHGVSVRGATLYTTTFPCHNCAKHVVGAGLSRIVYIEPYAKSLAEELHPDTIAIDKTVRTGDRVTFDPFIGVAPSIYLPLYSLGSIRRKHGGRAVSFDPRAAVPKLVPSGDLTYMERELLAVEGWQRTAAERGVHLAKGSR